MGNLLSFFNFTRDSIKYIDENILINKIIISFGFDESPNYILYLNSKKTFD